VLVGLVFLLNIDPLTECVPYGGHLVALS
jgi:hypothetical protein